ncbi:MAG: hypothetical protein GX897_06340 [Clostridiales bacterium]|nr:hypothetical protein [Clostridiales bacterium]
MKKQIISAVLAAALLFALISCGSTEQPAAESTTAAETQPDEAPDTTAAETEYPELEAKDFGGKEFRILAYNQGDPSTWFQYLDFGYSEEKKGDLINDAVWERNIAVEDKYGVKLINTTVEDVPTVAKKTIKAGSDEFDICQPYIDTAFQMAGEGMLVDVISLPYIELERRYWDENIRRDLTFKGKLWAITGDISMFDEELSCMFYWNRLLAEKYELGECYDYVRSGSWTIDKMMELGRAVVQDLNGDGVMDSSDVWGICDNYSVGRYWFFAFGGQMARVDENGDPVIVMGEEKSQIIFDAIGNMMNDSTVTILTKDIPDTWMGARAMMKEDRLLFLSANIYTIPYYRSMENDFGILPYPKLDENQDRYYNQVASWVCPGISIPVTNQDIDFTGYMLEALCRESSKILQPAYIDVNLMTKVTRDESSVEMLKLILDSKRYDLAVSFNWGNLSDIIAKCAENPSKFSSQFESKLKKTETAMAKTVEKFG